MGNSIHLHTSFASPKLHSLTILELRRAPPLLRRILTTAVIFFPSPNPNNEENQEAAPPPVPEIRTPFFRGVRTGDSGVARALSQLLSMVNNIPVSSRKYDVVRSLAEKLIDENHAQGHEALNDVNRAVLSAAFARSLSQFEAAVEELRFSVDGYGGGLPSRPVLKVFRRALNKVGRMRKRVMYPSDSSAEKLAAELLWLAQKMAACGAPMKPCGDGRMLRAWLGFL